MTECLSTLLGVVIPREGFRDHSLVEWVPFLLYRDLEMPSVKDSRISGWASRSHRFGLTFWSLKPWCSEDFVYVDRQAFLFIRVNICSTNSKWFPFKMSDTRSALYKCKHICHLCFVQSISFKILRTAISK